MTSLAIMLAQGPCVLVCYHSLAPSMLCNFRPQFLHCKVGVDSGIHSCPAKRDGNGLCCAHSEDDACGHIAFLFLREDSD